MAGKSVNYGDYVFIGGLAVAILVGLLASFIPAGTMPVLVALLLVLGIIVGLMNIKEKEVNTFLIATIALLLVPVSWNVALEQAFGLLGDIGTTITVLVAGITSALVALISPAAFIVAVKSIYKLAQPG